MADRSKRQLETLLPYCAAEDHTPANAPEVMSQEALRQRLSRIIAQTPAARDILHSPQARLVLRITDIAGWVRVDRHRLHPFARGKVERLSTDLQRNLSNFFHLWDIGRLYKRLEQGKGVLALREQGQSPPVQAASAGPKQMQIGIRVTAQGPKLRL